MEIEPDEEVLRFILFSGAANQFNFLYLELEELSIE